MTETQTAGSFAAIYIHKAEIGAVVGTVEGEPAGYHLAETVFDVKVGDVIWAWGRNARRRGIVTKVGRKNVTWEFTTPSSVAFMNEHRMDLVSQYGVMGASDTTKVTEVTNVWVKDAEEPAAALDAQREIVALAEGEAHAEAIVRAEYARAEDGTYPGLSAADADLVSGPAPEPTITEVQEAVTEALVEETKLDAVHFTNQRYNPFRTAGMLRQVGLVAKYGEAVDTAGILLDCETCSWVGTAESHADALNKRVRHESDSWTAYLTASRLPVVWPVHYTDNGRECRWSGSPRGRLQNTCPAGCDSSPYHYANDGHTECAEEIRSRPGFATNGVGPAERAILAESERA